MCFAAKMLKAEKLPLETEPVARDNNSLLNIKTELAIIVGGR